MPLYHAPTLLLALLMGLALPVHASEDGAPLSAEIERLAESIESATLEDPARQSLQSLLAQARAEDERATALLAEAAGILSEAELARSESASLEAELREDPAGVLAEWRTRIPADAGLARLEQALAEARGERDARLQALSVANATLGELSSQAAGLGAALDTQREQLETRRAAALSAQAAAAADGGLRARAQALAAQASRRASEGALRRLEAQQQTLPVRQRLWELRQRANERRYSLAEEKASELQARLTAARAEEIDARLAELQAELDTLGATDPGLADLAADNLALGQRLVNLERELNAATQAAAAANRANLRTEEALRNTQARLAIGGSEDALGLVLAEERRRLTDPQRLARNLDEVRRRYATAQLAQIELGEQAARLGNLADAVGEALRRHGADAEEADLVGLRAGYLQLMQRRASLYPDLVEANRLLGQALAEQERALQNQLATSQTLYRILERRLLWVPSHGRVDVAWLARQASGWHDLLKPSRFATTARLLGDAVVRYLPVVLMAALLTGLGIYWRRRLPERMATLSAPLRSIRTDSFRLTAWALGLCLLATLAVLAPVWCLAWLLRHAGEAGKYSHSLGLALQSVLPALLLHQMLGRLGQPGGLLEVHFRWTQNVRDALGRLRPWLLYALLPSAFLASLAFIRGLDPALDTAGRAALVAGSLVLAWLAWRELGPDGLWPGRRGDGSHLRRALRVALPAGLVMLAGLAMAGYVLTAGILYRNAWQSLLLLAAIALLRALVTRWLLLGERRLALRRYEARRAAEAEARAQAEADAESGEGTATAAAGPAEDQGDVLPEVEAEEIDLQSVNTQTRRLQRALVVLVLVLGLGTIWSDVLPALDRLDEVVLWGATDVDAQGQSIAIDVTLKALLFGLFVLLLTFVAARNLPGLMEVGLLTRAGVDAPTRYAITTLSRYVIVIAGVFTAAGWLGVRWSQLQWMAAALTVGLGFGLQEIFANFVSGLILLFERPFRVGDIITIGEFTGTVTKIRTRATTLVDFDNKEIVVPNKMFITERLTNWTLSDTRTRIIIKVGVAYGTDPDKVHALLQQVAREHPTVLAEPPPRSWFMAFGASSLDFELRVFVASIGDRLATQNALNGRIAKLFNEHGIEIAFPQLDLHVRDVPQVLEAKAVAAGGSEDGAKAGG